MQYHYFATVYFKKKQCDERPVTVAERSKIWTVFDRSEAGIVGSNPIQQMDVWFMCLFCVCVVLYLGRGLATSWSLVQGILPSVKMIMKLKKKPEPMGAVEPAKKKCDERALC
jgi:hypothetical protein